MGIVNVTRNSFSDGGKYFTPELALKHSLNLVAEGADIIDVGAESTRPNAEKLSAKDEITALLPVLKLIRKELPDTLISVDTYKAEVAEIALDEGADIINDIALLHNDDKTVPMFKLAAKRKCPIVATHNSRDKIYNSFWEDFCSDIKGIVDSAIAHGISAENLILDAGVGFGKTPEENFEIVRNIDCLKKYGTKTLLGVSKKSMFSQIAKDDFNLRETSTEIVSAFCAVNKKVDILRVHEVSPNIVAMKTALKLFS